MTSNGVQIVEYYISPVEVRDTDGNPNYQDREFIRIINPGGKDVVEREVRDTDKVTWMAQYQAFKNNVEFEGEGTKLSDISLLSKAEIEMCKKGKIYTVEQLSSLNDVGMKALGMGARTLTQKATNWLDGRKNIDTIVNKLHALEKKVESQADVATAYEGAKADVIKKDATIADLRNQIDELMRKPKK